MILICKVFLIVMNLGLFIGSVIALKNINVIPLKNTNKEENTVRLACYIILVYSVLDTACLLFN